MAIRTVVEKVYYQDPKIDNVVFEVESIYEERRKGPERPVQVVLQLTGEEAKKIPTQTQVCGMLHIKNLGESTVDIAVEGGVLLQIPPNASTRFYPAFADNFELDDIEFLSTDSKILVTLFPK